MLKKISLLTMATFAATYADIELDLHVVLTEGESVREINKKILAAENSSVELYHCEGGQLIGCIHNVTEEGVQLNVDVNECINEICTPISHSSINLIWNEKSILNLAHKDATLVIEFVVQQVHIAQ